MLAILHTAIAKLYLPFVGAHHAKPNCTLPFVGAHHAKFIPHFPAICVVTN